MLDLALCQYEYAGVETVDADGGDHPLAGEPLEAFEAFEAFVADQAATRDALVVGPGGRWLTLARDRHSAATRSLDVGGLRASRAEASVRPHTDRSYAES